MKASLTAVNHEKKETKESKVVLYCLKEVAELLIAKGSDVNVKGDNGQNAEGLARRERSSPGKGSGPRPVRAGRVTDPQSGSPSYSALSRHHLLAVFFYFHF